MVNSLWYLAGIALARLLRRRSWLAVVRKHAWIVSGSLTALAIACRKARTRQLQGDIASPKHGETSWKFAVQSIQGHRSTNEDRVAVTCKDGIALFAVFDGHSGWEASDYAAKRISGKFFRFLKHGDHQHRHRVEEALRLALRDLEERFMKNAKKRGIVAGTTACVAVVTATYIIVANVGDSRALFCPDRGPLQELTQDHHPQLPTERARIEAAGGSVLYKYGCYRVNGRLAVSRAIGNKDTKPYGVSAEPDVRAYERRTPGYLLVLSDGIVQKMSSQDVCNTLTSLVKGNEKPSMDELARRVVDKALETGSRDNLSVVIVSL